MTTAFDKLKQMRQSPLKPEAKAKHHPKKPIKQKDKGYIYKNPWFLFSLFIAIILYYLSTGKKASFNIDSTLVDSTSSLPVYGSLLNSGSDLNANDDQIDQQTDEVVNELTFHGDECTVDCSGHEAGYHWAIDNGISDVNSCNGNSASFEEGCQSYVEENY